MRCFDNIELVIFSIIFLSVLSHEAVVKTSKEQGRHFVLNENLQTDEIAILESLLERSLVSSKRQVSTSDANEFVNAHNAARSRVTPSATNMLKMEWSTELQNIAQSYANQCIWKHNSQRSVEASFYSVGENMFLTTASVVNATYVVEIWENEKTNFNFETGSCDSVCGHYTQVVWASTKYVGCGVKMCSSVQGVTGYNNLMLVVCNYGPGGNYIGQLPYDSGSTCSACPSGTNCVDSLCSPDTGTNTETEPTETGNTCYCK